MALSPRGRSGFKWTGLVLGSLVVLLGLALALIDWEALRGPISRSATAKSGRTVSTAGPLNVHIWSLTPRFEVNQLTVGNPPWEKARPMLQVERVNAQLKLLPLLKGAVILPR